MNKVYTRINWENYPSLVTPINEQNLNKLDFAMDSLDNRIINLDTTKVNVTTIQQNIANWNMDEETGIITITRVNGDTITFDLNIEKIPVGFELTDEGILIMTTDDGTQFKADIASMIPVLTFNNSDEIKVSVTGTGKNKTYTFSIIANSITEDKLETSYLANIKEETAKAKNHSDSASDYATLSKSYAMGSTGTRDGEDTDNSKYYYEKAKALGSVIDDTKPNALDTTFSAKAISTLTNTESDSAIMTRIAETSDNDLTTLTPYYSTTITKKLNNYITSITGFLGQLITGYNSLVAKVKSLISKNGSHDISNIGDGTITGSITALNSNLSNLIKVKIYTTQTNNIYEYFDAIEGYIPIAVIYGSPSSNNHCTGFNKEDWVDSATGNYVAWFSDKLGAGSKYIVIWIINNN